MLDLDEQALIEESKKHCEVFLQKEQRSLATFTRDPSLMYIPDPKLERFLLDPSKGVLYLPLQSFLDGKLDDNQIMWHIYYELSLYSDWKKQTKKYLNRKKDWQKEIDHSLISLILDPPLPMREPHWLAGTTSLRVTGGLLVAGLLLIELIIS